MTIFESRTISVGIARDWRDVYEFASVPQNFPKWASGLGRSFENVDGTWAAEGPEGPITIEFSERNPFGVLDHKVISSSGDIVSIPLRVIANGDGSEVLLTLFRHPSMSEEKYAADAAWVEKDLNTLKSLMEK